MTRAWTWRKERAAVNVWDRLVAIALTAAQALDDGFSLFKVGQGKSRFR